MNDRRISCRTSKRLYTANRRERRNTQKVDVAIDEYNDLLQRNDQWTMPSESNPLAVYARRSCS
jgi:hypothetical protein